MRVVCNLYSSSAFVPRNNLSSFMHARRAARASCRGRRRRYDGRFRFPHHPPSLFHDYRRKLREDDTRGWALTSGANGADAERLLADEGRARVGGRGGDSGGVGFRVGRGGKLRLDEAAAVAATAATAAAAASVTRRGEATRHIRHRSCRRRRF